MSDSASTVCGKTKGHPAKDREIWWWNEYVSRAVKDKRNLFLALKKSNSQEDRAAYRKANKETKRIISRAKDQECRNFGEKCEQELKKGKIFNMVKQIVRKNKDVTSCGCVRDNSGKVVTEEEKIRGVWKEYFDKLLNEEFSWDRNSLESCEMVCGPSECITREEVRHAVKLMKNGKAAGPSGIVSEMLKAAGEDGISWMTELFNKIVVEGMVPSDWKKSWMVTVYKGKGDALECGSYRGIKLLDHAMKVFERVLERKIRGSVKIDDQQFGFQPGKGTTDAIFIVRQMQEKFLGKKKELWMGFVDLEKAFDRVPREVLWWALRSVGLCEWLIKVIMSLYEGVTTAVKVGTGISSEFGVKVGVHQGSVLSPLLFTIVLEALTRKCRGGLPWELLFADDLVLLASTEDELKDKIRKWKKCLEDKGLKVNIAKTKVMRCSCDGGVVIKSGKHPCGMCGKGVGGNSIKCLKCKQWIHKRCSNVKGPLGSKTDYKCPKCIGARVGLARVALDSEMILDHGVELEYVNEFCYLGDMIGAAGGAGNASVMRVNCAWRKFREMAPVLTNRGVSLKLKGLLYRVCVQSVLVYGSETWPMKREDEQRVLRTERMMVRWMCGVSLREKIPSDELIERLGISSVLEIISRGRLRWFGHVERKEDNDWVKACQNFVVPGKVGVGRKRRTWKECVEKDMKSKGLTVEDAQDRVIWRWRVLGKRPTHASVE